MYDPDNKFAFLTSLEKTFNTVSFKRVCEFIEQGTVTIHIIELSENTFGEFLFVEAKVKGKPLFLTFVSRFGYHFKKECYITTEGFTFYDGASSRCTGKAIPLATLTSRYHDYLSETIRNAKKHDKDLSDYEKKRNEIYDLLCDLADEDFASVEIEDLDIDDF
ncbi:MAG: hypothetical protein ACFFD4_09010 [Candidatus Odinarchaeota archaeon]